MALRYKFKKRIKHYISLFRGKPIIANVTVLAPNKFLSGHTALITGGTSGIGFAIAKSFLNSGANVIITGRTETRLKTAENELMSKKCEGGGNLYTLYGQQRCTHIPDLF